jgi:UPF0271 protein
MIDGPAAVGAQAVSLVRDREVTAVDGTRLSVTAETICIHGDLPGAAERAAATRAALETAGVEIAPLRA